MEKEINTPSSSELMNGINLNKIIFQHEEILNKQMTYSYQPISKLDILYLKEKES